MTIPNQDSRTHRSVFVTGANTGLGYELALGLASTGASVTAGLLRPDSSPDAQSALRGAGVNVVALDVTDDASVVGAVQAAIDFGGSIDGVVNNAGIAINGPVEAATPDQVLAQFNVNVVGPHRVMRAAVPHMVDRGRGIFIQVSTGAARWVIPSNALYCASKAALEAMSEAMEIEMAEFGIRTVILELGPMRTAFLRSNALRVGDDSRLERYSGLLAAEQADVDSVFVHGQDSLIEPTEIIDIVRSILDAPPPAGQFRVVRHPRAEQLARINSVAETVGHEVRNDRSDVAVNRPPTS